MVWVCGLERCKPEHCKPERVGCRLEQVGCKMGHCRQELQERYKQELQERYRMVGCMRVGCCKPEPMEQHKWVQRKRASSSCNPWAS